jgi:hypothetical protein
MTKSKGSDDISSRESRNILGAYFSHSGNTRKIVPHIHESIGGDISGIMPWIRIPD